MKIRIKPYSVGIKGFDWQRMYSVDVKTFLIWRRLKTFTNLNEASDFVKSFADYNELIFIKYL